MKKIQGYTIDYEALAASLLQTAKPIKKTKPKTIAPPKDDAPYAEHSAEPLKKKNDIKRLREYFLNKQEYRNHMLFVVGISIGLRYSDLIRLRFIDVMDTNLNYRTEIIMPEKKTRKKRKFSLSPVAINAIDLYINKKLNYNFDLSDYLFVSESSNAKYSSSPNKPLTKKGVYDIFDKAYSDLNLPYRHGTHLLRKTFAYHILTGTNDPIERVRRLEILQHMLNHSSPSITLEYAGITFEEESTLYQNLTFDLDVVQNSTTLDYDLEA